jgi:hypothetical protein
MGAGHAPLMPVSFRLQVVAVVWTPARFRAPARPMRQTAVATSYVLVVHRRDSDPARPRHADRSRVVSAVLYKAVGG